MRTILVFVVLLGLPLSARAQAGSFLQTTKPDVAATYQFMRSNTQPGQCGCFILRGAGLSASWTFRPNLVAVIEGDADFASNGPGTGNSITFMSGIVGVRYRLPVQPPGRREPQLFTEVMAGAGHAGGEIAGAGDGSFAFVGHAGGGFDEPLTERFALRFEADYAPTTFANSVNNHQNNLLIAVGFVFHWPRSR